MMHEKKCGMIGGGLPLLGRILGTKEARPRKFTAISQLGSKIIQGGASFLTEYRVNREEHVAKDGASITMMLGVQKIRLKHCRQTLALLVDEMANSLASHVAHTHTHVYIYASRASCRIAVKDT